MTQQNIIVINGNEFLFEPSETILEVGGSTDIAEAFEAFRGRPPKIEPLLEQDGILKPGEQA